MTYERPRRPRHNFREKLFVGNLLLFFSMVIIVYFGLYQPMVDTIYADTLGVLNAQVLQIADQIDHDIDRIIHTSDLVQQSSSYAAFLQNDDSYVQQIRNYWVMSGELRTIKIYYDDLIIRVYVNGAQLAAKETVTFFSNEELLAREWYDELVASNGGILWISEDEEIAAVRIMRRNYDQIDDNIYTSIGIPKDRLAEHFFGNYEGLPVGAFLTDARGEIVLSSIAQTSDEYAMHRAMLAASESENVIVHPIAIDGWHIRLTALDLYSERLNRLQLVFWLCVVVAFIAFSLFSNHIVGGIRKLEREKRKIEIVALQSQIKPHFIYNTLDTINWEMIKNRQYESAGVIVNLASFLRKSLGDVRELVTLADELSHITMYVNIVSYKWESEIALRVQAPNALRQVEMVKFTLQPLIENSIEHGFRTLKGRRAAIDVRAMEKDGYIFLTIEDNGVGFDAEQAPPNEEGHYGISNVERRLALHYEGYSIFRISSVPGEGTRVIIGWPIRNRRP